MNRIAALDQESAATAAQPASLETVVGNLAHELANPLNAISMTAELAKRMLARGQGEKAMHVLENIGTDCERCARLLGDAQDYVSLEIRRTHETFDLAAMLEEIAQPLRMRGDVVIQASEDCRIEGDARALRRLFREVLRNAFDHGARRVDVGLQSDTRTVTARIADDGPGIDPALRARIFDTFYSTQRQQHSGIGLSLARRIAQALDGNLEIEDAEQGAVFRIILPRRR